jgi:hypothetical protein
MAREGQTVVPGGTGGKSLEAQEKLAEGTGTHNACRWLVQVLQIMF